MELLKNIANIASFNKVLSQFNNNPACTPMKLVKVINLSASEATLIERQQTRVATSATQRVDDGAGIYLNRLKGYTEGMCQVIEHYKSHSEFFDIDTTVGIEITTKEILCAMNSETPLVGVSLMLA